ncbi:MAG: ABC transporter permease, partial [Deltaproteobacteria bacterium]|nr:ABC transporter permease [Deltaproteobacteria bacterium]
MRALDRKLLRDLWKLRAQGLSVALVVACGITTFVAGRSTLVSLRESQRAFYDRSNFADVFAHISRAPDSVRHELERVPGVAAVETRIVRDVTLDMPGLDEPAVGRVVSVDPRPERTIQRLFIREGEPLDEAHGNEVLLSEQFAKAHRLRRGSTVVAVLAGRRVTLRVAGVALSPEHIFAAAGDLVPDDRRFGILW